MSTLSFTAHCERGHDRVDFTDPKAFEAHCTTVHKARKITRPAWLNPNPLPWKAPKAPTTTEKLTAVLVEAGDWGGKYRAGRHDRYTHLDADWATDELVAVADLEPGDTFVAAAATRIRYTVLGTDPERGWNLRMDNTANGNEREGWVSRLRIGGGDLETVIRLKRAA